MTEQNRFADEKLQEFFDLYRHTDEKIDAHIEDEAEFRAMDAKRQARRDELLDGLITEVRELKESTSGVVMLFKEGKIGQKWLVRIGQAALWIAAVYGVIKALFGK